MNRIALILCLVLFAAGPAQAETSGTESAQDRLVMALQDEGYVIVQTERTWLGRLRIVATKGGLRREVVINPGTGEVLRDIASAGAEDESSEGNGSAVASSGQSGSNTVGTTATTGSTSAVAPASGGSNPGVAGTVDSVDSSRDVLLPEAGVLQ